MRLWFTAMLCIHGLVACSDGYPTEDVVEVAPSQMSKAQLLAALNALGQETHLDKRWRYALRADCELEVTVRNGDTVRHSVSLAGTRVDLRSTEGVTEVLLLPDAGGTGAVTVLETTKWVDTVRAQSLFNHLEMRCGTTAGTADQQLNS